MFHTAFIVAFIYNLIGFVLLMCFGRIIASRYMVHYLVSDCHWQNGL